MARVRRKSVAEINVVPYIDVMLVLLVIFMITAPMLTQGVAVDLPKADSEAIATKDVPPMIVSVNKVGQFFINAENQANIPLTQQNLLIKMMAEIELAKRERRQIQVLVKGDSAARYGQVMALMVLLKKAGIKKVGLLTKPLSDTPSMRKGRS